MDELQIDTEVGRLHVFVVGSGPPVVLWHSMFVDSRSWDRLVPLLAGRTLYLIDGPSMGRSEHMTSPADIAACARAAATIVDAICTREQGAQVDWVGNAWGGHVGMELAARRPDRIASLVAMSAPTFPIDAAMRRQISLLLPLYRILGPRGPVRAAIVEAMFTDETRAHDPGAVSMLDDSLRCSGRALLPAVHTAILRRTDLAWATRRITCPVLLITTDDRGEWTTEQAAPIAAEMADARVVEITGARILPAVEQPTATAEAIVEFWAQARVNDRG